MYMGSPRCLNVNGEAVKTIDIRYEQLIWLYNDFKNKNGKLPTQAECLLKNNLPQGRIVQKVLKDNNISFNSFMISLGKVKHVRTESKDYNYYLNLFKEINNKRESNILAKDLFNNEFGLPSPNWFVKYCPDKNVKSFNDFILWCGFGSNKLKKDDDLISEKLIELENTLKRPITRNDISLEKTGFSMIVVNRIWGSLTKAKNTLGLMKTLPCQPRPFEFYKNYIDNLIIEFKKIENRNFISWNDIENNKYLGWKCEHKTIQKAFRKENIDFYGYIKNKDLTIKPSSIGYTYLFDDGEYTKSIFEYDFSNFLRNELNLNYRDGYMRDVRYSSFSDVNSRINCDYVLNINNKELYIEVAGIIYNSKNNDWKDRIYKTEMENKYRDCLIKKEKILMKNKKEFILLFPNDMKRENYKTIVKNKLKENRSDYGNIKPKNKVL